MQFPFAFGYIMAAVPVVFLEQTQCHRQTIDDLLFFNIQPQMTCIGRGKMKTAEAHSQVVKYLAQFQATLDLISVQSEITELQEYM